MITALWRASETIAFIVYIGSKLISPSILILLTFLLCSILSVLIETSLGIAATMGVIYFSIGKAIGVNPYYAGGAVLSGIYFGDRCSPMYTSALLISELTKTDLYKNIKLMIKTSIKPFIVTCLFYLFLGFKSTVSSVSMDVTEIFKQNYNLNIVVIIPAILIIIFSLLKINVKKTMLISIVISSIISGAIACNQSLGIILTNELSEELVDKKERAIILENTVVLLVGLIPWNIAMDVPLKTINGGIIGIFCFLFIFLAIVEFIFRIYRKKKIQNKNLI